MDRALKKQLQQYAQLFQEARERNINEADTVMYLSRFLSDVLGFDPFHELTKEFQVKERFCDLAVKLAGEVKYLIEAKAAQLNLSDRHIEQAANYASRSGIPWVVLTNGIMWRLYHLTFDSGGIEHDLAFETTLSLDGNLEDCWNYLSLLSQDSMRRGRLADFWEHKKCLSPHFLLRGLFTEEVLSALRRELHHKVRVRLEIDEIAHALRRLLNPEVLTEDLKIRKGHRPRRSSESGQGKDVEDHVEDTDSELSEQHQPEDDHAASVDDGGEDSPG